MDRLSHWVEWWRTIPQRSLFRKSSSFDGWWNSSFGACSRGELERGWERVHWWIPPDKEDGDLFRPSEKRFFPPISAIIRTVCYVILKDELLTRDHRFRIDGKWKGRKRGERVWFRLHFTLGQRYLIVIGCVCVCVWWHIIQAGKRQQKDAPDEFQCGNGGQRECLPYLFSLMLGNTHGILLHFQLFPISVYDATEI